MLALTEVVHINDASYRQCKEYLRYMKNFGLEANTDFKYEHLYKSCGSCAIGVLHACIRAYLGFEEGSLASISEPDDNIKTSYGDIVKQLMQQQQQQK